MGHPFVMLDGVVAPDELAAARVAWLLWQRLGFSITPYERTVSPAWLAVRGGLHEARVVAVEAKASDLVLCLDKEWANEAEAQWFGGPGDLIIAQPQVLVGSLEDCEKGWISEITLADAGRLVIDFCDRARLEILCAEVRWQAYGSP